MRRSSVVIDWFVVVENVIAMCVQRMYLFLDVVADQTSQGSEDIMDFISLP